MEWPQLPSTSAPGHYLRRRRALSAHGARDRRTACPRHAPQRQQVFYLHEPALRASLRTHYVVMAGCGAAPPGGWHRETAQAGLLAHTLCSCGGVRGSAPRWVAQGDFYLKLYVLYAKLGVISSCNAYALVISSPGQGDNLGSIPGTVFFDFCHIQAPKTPISGSCLQKEC